MNQFTFDTWNIDQFARYHIITVECTVSGANNDFVPILTKVSRIDRKWLKKHTLNTRIVSTIHLHDNRFIIVHFYTELSLMHNAQSQALNTQELQQPQNNYRNLIK